MDNGWDHTENEDKVLLNQSWDLGQVRDQDMQVTSVRTMANTKDGCSSMSGGCELVSLSGEYGKHLLSVVLNNINQYYNQISTINIMFSFYNFYYPVNRLYAFICEICKICFCCDAKCKCECKCKCDSPCKGKFICLCLCTNAKGGAAKECCICICKHKDCNCICICICKNSDKWCCESGSEHGCKECLVKIDIQSLLCNTSRILYHLRRIRWYKSIIQNSCCSCSCCEIICCNKSCCEKCQTIINCYKSIISNADCAVSCFGELSIKFEELIQFKKKLLSFFTNAKTCEPCKICNCKDKINSLICNVEKALRYYSLFRSRIQQLKYKLEYKLCYGNINEIIWSLKLSLKQNLKNLKQISEKHDINSISSNKQFISNWIISIYDPILIFCSDLSIKDSYFVSLHLKSVIDHMNENLETLKPVNNCWCVCSYEKICNNECESNSFTILFTTPNFKLNSDSVDNTDNHLCLCLVIKYRLVPVIVRLSTYLFYTYVETSNTFDRKHDKYLPNLNLIWDMSKLIFLVLGMIEKIVIIMERRYISQLRSNPLSFINKDTNLPNWFKFIVQMVYHLSWWIDKKYFYELLKCFCKFPNDEYYPYLISTILFVSSLIENIWSMDSESISMAIQKLSCLVAEYHSMGYYPHIPNLSSDANNNSTSNANITSSLSMTLNQYIKTISVKAQKENGACNANGESSMVLHTQINRSELLLLNTGVKSFFKTILSSLSILIATPLFSLIYSNISGLSFYIIGNKPIIGFSSIFMRRVVNSISVKYLECPKKEQECTCLKNNGCKVCIVFKINYLTLSITVKVLRYVLSTVIIDLITKSKSFNVIITDMNRISINKTELILRRTKNNLLTHLNYDISVNPLNTVKSTNWGYDTYYEHHVTTFNGIRSDGYPNINNQFFPM